MAESLRGSTNSFPGGADSTPGSLNAWSDVHNDHRNKGEDQMKSQPKWTCPVCRTKHYRGETECSGYINKEEGIPCSFDRETNRDGYQAQAEEVPA